MLFCILCTLSFAPAALAAPPCDTCAGTAESCGDFSDQTSCNAHSAIDCHWSTTGACTGTATACSALGAEQCTNTNGSAPVSVANRGCYSTCAATGDSCSNYSEGNCPAPCEPYNGAEFCAGTIACSQFQTGESVNADCDVRGGSCPTCTSLGCSDCSPYASDASCLAHGCTPTDYCGGITVDVSGQGSTCTSANWGSAACATFASRECSDGGCSKGATYTGSGSIWSCAAFVSCDTGPCSGTPSCTADACAWGVENCAEQSNPGGCTGGESCPSDPASCPNDNFCQFQCDGLATGPIACGTIGDTSDCQSVGCTWNPGGTCAGGGFQCSSLSASACDTATYPGCGATPACTASGNDLSITKQATAKVGLGDVIIYTMSVSARGAADAVVVTDPLPAEVRFDVATASVGSCTAAANTVTCDLGDLADGATATITISAVAVGETSAATNTASATESNTDADPSNNSASASSEIDAAATPVLAGNFAGGGCAGKPNTDQALPDVALWPFALGLAALLARKRKR